MPGSAAPVGMRRMLSPATARTCGRMRRPAVPRTRADRAAQQPHPLVPPRTGRIRGRVDRTVACAPSRCPAPTRTPHRSRAATPPRRTTPACAPTSRRTGAERAAGPGRGASRCASAAALLTGSPAPGSSGRAVPGRAPPPPRQQRCQSWRRPAGPARHGRHRCDAEPAGTRSGASARRLEHATRVGPAAPGASERQALSDFLRSLCADCSRSRISTSSSVSVGGVGSTTAGSSAFLRNCTFFR